MSTCAGAAPASTRERAMVAATRAELAGAVRLLNAVVDDTDVTSAAGRAALADELYTRWYVRCAAPATTALAFPTDLAQVLRAADGRDATWEGGWRVDRVAATGTIIARRDDEVRLCDRSSYIAPGRPGSLPLDRDEVIVTGRRDLVDPDGGWWRTASASWDFIGGHSGLIRLYWNVQIGALPTLVTRCTAVLAADRAPWMLKVACDPTAQTRADGAVLFVTADRLGEHAGALTTIAEELAGAAITTAPPLTLHVRPGLAVAVNPGGVSSFGQHRCRLIVDGYASIAGRSSVLDAVESVTAAFAADGIDAHRPWARRSDPQLPWEPRR